jgi:hypothetical protein
MTQADEAISIALPREVVADLLAAAKEAICQREAAERSSARRTEKGDRLLSFQHAAFFADEALSRSEAADARGRPWTVMYRYGRDEIGYWETFDTQGEAVRFSEGRLERGAEVVLSSRPHHKGKQPVLTTCSRPIAVTEGDVQEAVERARTRIQSAGAAIAASEAQNVSIGTIERNTIELYGSHGGIVADALTGEIVEYDEDDDSYRVHSKVDIDEFIIRTGEYPDGAYDILDFALFNRDGTYAPAELERATDGWEDYFAGGEMANPSG